MPLAQLRRAARRERDPHNAGWLVTLGVRGYAGEIVWAGVDLFHFTDGKAGEGSTGLLLGVGFSP